MTQVYPPLEESLLGCAGFFSSCCRNIEIRCGLTHCEGIQKVEHMIFQHRSEGSWVFGSRFSTGVLMDDHS